MCGNLLIFAANGIHFFRFDARGPRAAGQIKGMTLMANRQTHYVSPKLAARPNPEKGNYGLFAETAVSPGELLVMWGGDIVTGAQLARLSERERMHALQVEADLYQVPCRAEPEAGDYVNHSCDPNAGLRSPISLVAMRAIQPGEEICFDYAMSDSTPYDEFECGCGAPICRGRVTGSDWQRPDLQQKYRGYFSPYLQRKIAQTL